MYFENIKGAFLIDNIHTDIICHNFEDKIFVVITQFQKLGSLVLVSKDTSVTELGAAHTYSTNVLLGKDEDLLHVLGRSLAVSIPLDKPVLFSLALNDYSPKVLAILKEQLIKYKVW